MKKIDSKSTLAWYDVHAEEYAEKTKDIDTIHTIHAFLAMLSVDSPKILDVACGAGRDAEKFKELGVDVFGLDLAKKSLLIAKKKCPEITFVHANFLKIPYSDSSFDGVWALAALVHLETIKDVKQAFSEFNRILKMDGVLYVSVKEIQQGIETNIVSDTLSNHDRFFRYYSENELTSYASEAGFTIENIFHENDFVGRSDVTWLRMFARKSGVHI